MQPDPQAVLSYIIGYKRQWGGDSPTIREIGQTFGIASTSQVSEALNRLENAGLIRRRPGRAGIAVAGGRWEYGPQSKLIEDFVKRVCERAEATIAQSHKLEGAHYAAMRRELSAMLNSEADDNSEVGSG